MSSIHAYTERTPNAYQSQHGEDRWLEQYFEGRRDGFFVEVGAYDGVVLSNSFYLESIGWRGLLVEPNPGKAAECRENRPLAKVFECAAVGSGNAGEVSFEVVEGGEVYSTLAMSPEHSARLAQYGLQARKIIVRGRTLDSILEEARLPRVDYVSIDVEGGELDVLRGFSLQRWHPAVVMIEVNERIRRPEIRDAFTSSGYVYLRTLGINDVYVPLRTFRSLARAIDAVRYSSGLVRRALRRGARMFAHRDPL